MPDLLLVLPGAEEQRELFRGEARGAWSAALPLVLEKHGLLATTCTGVAGAAARLEDHAVVVLARPRSREAVALAHELLDRDVPCLIEGPLPAELDERIGVRTLGPAPREDRLVGTDRAFTTAGGRLGHPPVAVPGTVVAREVARESGLEWRALPGVPIEEAQAKAWSAVGWDTVTWAATAEVDVVAEWRDDTTKATRPAIVRHGNAYVCAFELLALLGQTHTSGPWGTAEFRTSGRSSGCETVLLGAVDDLFARAGRPRVRVLPWPRGVDWVLNVRHDFDRFLGEDVVERLLDGHQASGTAATWYWRTKHLTHWRSGRKVPFGRQRRASVRAVRAVQARAGHEVALHTQEVWRDGPAERAALEHALGEPVLGTCAHGSADSFRFQGAPNVLWAEAQGLRYTEFLERSHFHPHRFPALEADGEVRPLDVLCLPHHESFDRSMTQGDTATERIERMAVTFASTGGMLQVMNHPDLHPEALFATLRRLPRDGAASWTAAQATSWWRRTHTLDAVRARRGADGELRLTVRDDVEGLGVEVRAPDGTTSTTYVDLAAGDPSGVRVPAVG